MYGTVPVPILIILFLYPFACLFSNNYIVYCNIRFPNRSRWFTHVFGRCLVRFSL